MSGNCYELTSRDINTCTISGTVTTVEPYKFSKSDFDYTFFRVANREYRKKTFIDVSYTKVNIFACIIHDDGIIVNKKKLKKGSKVVVSGRLSMLPSYKFGENALYLLVERLIICGHKEEKE